MKTNIYFLLIFLTFGLSETIRIPEDYNTIQEGIDASVDGDTVLVANGDYIENLVLDKSIVLASYAIFDNLDEWIIFDDLMFNQWVVNNSHIENTRLIGSNPDDPDYGSVILITPDSEECISPEIIGFTIQGGRGTTVLREDNEQIIEVVLGGGILADVSNPYIHYNAFVNNGSDEIFSGGGSYLTSDGTEWSFGDLNRFQNHNPRCEIEEFRLSNNLYNGNDAQYGNTMANRFHENQFDMSGSIFDVFDCSNEENSVSSVWVKVESTASVNYDDGVGQLCAFTSPNVYVDPSIEQECLDEGCGFQNNPFKTINRALEMINPSQESQVTMNLSVGTYSPSANNESFPILLQPNMTLLGVSDSLTIIDAEEINTVLSIIDCSNSYVGNLTITGGNNSNSYEIYPGGGVYIRSSTSEMYNVTISDNFSIADGGGIHLMVSELRISNSNIFDNFSNYWGGGIYNETSYVDFFNVSINNNTSVEMGGGIHCNLCYDSHFYNTVMNGNSSPLGSAIYSKESIISVNHSTIVNNIGNTLIYLDSDSSHNNNQNFNISNSILWNNQSNNFYDLDSQLVIEYSNIEGGFGGLGNIDEAPLLDEGLELQINSPCIDSGNPDPWFQDQDGSLSDMGSTGGLFLKTNFTNYNFGEIGSNESSTELTFFNYRESSILIDSVSFNTEVFFSNTAFPLIISSNESSSINIIANNSISGDINGQMEMTSSDLPEDINIDLSAIGVQDLTLSGNLIGNISAATYRITGDILVTNNETVIVEPGTKFLFDGDFNFIIDNGTLQAIGSESDSIIFENINNFSSKWRGFTIQGATNETIFEYVRVSGAEKTESFQGAGAGMLMLGSAPVLNHVIISDNRVDNQTYGNGGGIYTLYSSPILSNVTINDNYASHNGGGMAIFGGNPILDNLIVHNNQALDGAGIHFIDVNMVCENMLIYHNNVNEWINEDGYNGYGGGVVLENADIDFINSTITDNQSEYAGALYLSYESNLTLVNSIVWGNIPNSIFTDTSFTITDIRYSNIEGQWDGVGNINDDPLFLNSENYDFTLQDDSPCIDSGTKDIDGDGIDDIADYIGLAPDMGFYESDISTEIFEGDINFDNNVDILDIVLGISIIIGNTDYTNEQLIALDINQDGNVNVLDIVQLIHYILEI